MRFSEPMPDQVRVRLARDEKRRLTELAESRGQSLSDLVRSLLPDDQRAAA